MKAMIFAAGKGTRLKPLTGHTPKALIKLNNITMLEHVIQKLITVGVKDIIVNVHYLADQIIEFLKSKNNFGVNIEISDESDVLLETGGGLKKASWFFDYNEPFIVYNTDVISNIDLVSMMKYHKQKKSLVTLAVRKRESGRYFLFNEELRLCGWEKVETHERVISKKANTLNQLAFSGIHIINPTIFKNLNTNGAFSIIEIYLELAKMELIYGFDHSNDYWFDIGNPANLEIAEKYLKSI